VKYNKTIISKHTSYKVSTAAPLGIKLPFSGSFITAEDHKPNMYPTAAASGLSIYHFKILYAIN
jgi:hypothetical protein